jgi:hypothetical protein
MKLFRHYAFSSLGTPRHTFAETRRSAEPSLGNTALLLYQNIMFPHWDRTVFGNDNDLAFSSKNNLIAVSAELSGLKSLAFLLNENKSNRKMEEHA